MRTLNVELGSRSYPIHIGRDLLQQQALWLPCLRGRQVMIVSSETVAPLYLDSVAGSLREADREVATVVLPDGESHKTLASVEQILDALMAHRFGRDCTVVALGGGVIGDVAGFAAACYQRGVALIQVPTTLLAQVDSSVGGKTGVNHPRGKNMIGAFHQPLGVIADIGVLDTLGERELRAGLAEVIKYGLIADAEFLSWLEANMPRLLARDEQALMHAIEVSCLTKAAIVAEDEREAGRRALLNLGHTFGHAIETGTGYGTWLHGEAVAAGMLMAADMSCRMGNISTQDVARIKALLEAAGLPVAAPAGMDADAFLELMASDKKVLAGQLRLVLLDAIGNARVRADFDPAMLRATLEGFRRAA